MFFSSEVYLDNLFTALGMKLIDGHPLYSKKDGHLRFARETGYALNDFNDKQQKDILLCIYSRYVKACNLQPLLSAIELKNEMITGIEQAKAKK